MNVSGNATAPAPMFTSGVTKRGIPRPNPKIPLRAHFRLDASRVSSSSGAASEVMTHRSRLGCELTQILSSLFLSPTGNIHLDLNFFIN